MQSDIGNGACLRPRPHVVGYFGKRRLFSPNTATVHTYPAFSGIENGGFQIRTPGWRVLKTKIHRFHVDGRKRRFSNAMTSCPGSRLALPHIRFENGYVWTEIFLIRRKKKPSIFENTRLRKKDDLLRSLFKRGSKFLEFLR